jgi:hypothetical protein
MPESIFKFLPQAVKIHRYGFASGYDIQIYRRQHGREVSEYFSHAALKPVTYDCTANLFTDGYSQSRIHLIPRLPDDKQPLGGVLMRRTGKPQKLSPFPQSHRL